MSTEQGLFFGVGTGRCGTMSVANVLNSEPEICCLHEGKVRTGMEQGDQILAYLTLENMQAYLEPEKAVILLRQNRQSIDDVKRSLGVPILGDIAYYYAPFVGALADYAPNSKLIVFFRDGRDFARSATVLHGEDETPVGWPADDKPMTAVEQFISFGRLRPVGSDQPGAEWQSFSPFIKNAWLWAETNRLILEGLTRWDPKRIFEIRYEDFFAAPLDEYSRLRSFLGFEGPVPACVEDLFGQKINSKGHYDIAPWEEICDDEKAVFERVAGSMMRQLGYWQ